MKIKKNIINKVCVSNHFEGLNIERINCDEKKPGFIQYERRVLWLYSLLCDMSSRCNINVTGWRRLFISRSRCPKMHLLQQMSLGLFFYGNKAREEGEFKVNRARCRKPCKKAAQKTAFRVRCRKRFFDSIAQFCCLKSNSATRPFSFTASNKKIRTTYRSDSGCRRSHFAS